MMPLFIPQSNIKDKNPHVEAKMQHFYSIQVFIEQVYTSCEMKLKM